MQIPAAQIGAVMPDERILVHSALFETYLVDASTVPVFAEAMLTTGTVNADGTATINLAIRWIVTSCSLVRSAISRRCS